MIDVGIAIDGEAIDVIRTTRAPDGYDANGKALKGAAAATAIRVAIQPASGRQLMDLPEGVRSEARWLLWSRSEVKLDDEIASEGLVYRIMYVWPRAEGGFFRAALGQMTK